jgi:hypothetical protein
MFQPNTVKVFSIVAMALSAIGLMLSAVALVFFKGDVSLFAIIGIISWALLLWASYIGFRLTFYKLYEDEYKKVGIRIYLIIGAFILFFFVGFVLGLALSIGLLASLWALKSNYDDWNNDPDAPPPGIIEDVPPSSD